MRTTHLWLIGLVLLLAGCNSGSAAERPYTIVADVEELMLTILEPAAEAYWDAVGWILEGDSTIYFRPTSSEEWDAVRNAAFVVAESGNLLMMEGRALDDGAWVSMAQAMTAAARQAIEAAEYRDERGVFDAGAEIYYTCNACHGAYALDLLRPSQQDD